VRVLFVFPDLSSTTTDYTGSVSYGIASLSATLRASGHDPSLLHLTSVPREEEFRARVRAACPDLIAFSTNSHYARRIGAWTAWARDAARAPVVVGGIHPTLAPADVAALPAVDFTCVGEGEAPLNELCAALDAGRDPARIANLWVRRGADVLRNPPRPLLQDLATLPDPDLGLFGMRDLTLGRSGTFPYLTSRGCAYGCTYCCTHGLRRSQPRHGRFWRFLPPETAVAQLRRLLDRHMPDARLVTFLDSIFCPDRGWLERFAPLYRERIGIPASLNMRADRVDEPVADLLAAMGAAIVRLGVESGDERISREVLRRSLGLDDIRAAFARLRARGIVRWSYNMVGLPTETLRESLATVRLNAEIAPEIALPFIFYPYPGTELHRLSAERGWLTGREFDHYKEIVALRLPGFPESDVLFVHRFFAPLIRLYRAALRLPGRTAAPATRALDAALTSRWMPRRALVAAHEAWRGARHRAGVTLVRRAPALYRMLGGHAPPRACAPALAGSHRAADAVAAPPAMG
jgi:radical SAM superfamily enzyme YgiQ (UPF0313 family)